MTGQRKEKRRRPVACLRYRRMLVLSSLFSLVVLLCCCCEPAQASSGDSGNSNSNSNDARQPAEMPPADDDVVDNDDSVDAAGDAARVPGSDSVEDTLRMNARSGHVEDAEEVGKPTAAATSGLDEGAGEEDGGGSVPLTPADPAALGAASLAGAAASSSGMTSDQRATQAGAADQEDAVDIMQQYDAAAPHSAAGPVDVDADTPSSAVTSAADAIQGSELDQNSHQHDTNILAVGDEGGDSGGGGLSVSTEFDAGREKSLTAAEAASAPGVDTAEDRPRNEGERKDETLRLKGNGGKEAGGPRDETDRPGGLDELVEEEETKEAVRRGESPMTDGDYGEAAGNSSEEIRSGATRLGVSTAAADDSEVADSATADVGGDTDAEPTAAAAAAALAAEESEEQRLPPVQPPASEKEPSLDAQSSDTDAVQAKDIGGEALSPAAGDDDAEADGFASDGEGDSAAGTGTSTASAGGETQSVRTPSGTSSPPESAAAVGSELGEELFNAEGSSGSYSGGGGGGGGGGGADDHGVADGGPADGHRPMEDSDVEAKSDDHSSRRTSGGSGGRKDAKEHQKHDGQGENKKVRESREEAYPHHGGDDVDGGGDGASGSSGGAAEFLRGPPEEMAQRVRDMETELVRKLLAEEDAKSLLDIWVERAREYVLTQTVPPTDAECDFNWSRLRCEPKCTCGARLRFGDYTPGRACRLLHPWERNPELCGGGVDGDAGGGSGGGNSGGGGGAWDPSDEPAVRRVVAAAAGALGGLRQAYEARVAPPSDSECSFSFETRRCEPQPLCRLRFRWGDLAPSSACRLAGGASSDEKKHRATATTHKSPGGGTFH
ncbi:unnamed protein product [Ectocarpus fasciculatus]